MWDDEDTIRDDIDGAPIALKFSGRDEKLYSHFSVFVWNGDTIEIGDCVLVSGGAHNYVGRVEDIWDSLHPTKDEKYRIKVAWYEQWNRFAKSKQKRYLRSLPSLYSPPLDDELVLYEGESYGNEVPISSVLKRCQVLELSPDADLQRVLDDTNDCDDPVYISRFSCDKNKMTLKPLMSLESNELCAVSAEALPGWVDSIPAWQTSLRPFEPRNYRNACRKAIELFTLQERKAEKARKAVVKDDTCYFAGDEYRPGDFVFISNGEEDVERDTFENAFCVRIDGIDEQREGSELSVTYFVRLRDFKRERLLVHGLPHVDPPFVADCEAALQVESCGETVGANAIIGKFKLFKASASQDPRLVISEAHGEKCPVLVTRFAIVNERLVPFPKARLDVWNSSLSSKSCVITRKESSTLSSSKPRLCTEALPDVRKLSDKDLACALASEESDEEDGCVIPNRITKVRSYQGIDSDDGSDDHEAFECTNRADDAPPLSPKNTGLPRRSKSAEARKKTSKSTEKENLPPVKKTPVKQMRSMDGTDADSSPGKRVRRGSGPGVATPSSVVARTLENMSLEDEFVRTPTVNAFSAKAGTASSVKIRLKDLFGNVKLPERGSPVLNPETPLLRARSLLHAAAVPQSLPCREREFAEIYAFADTHIQNGTGGCMYISGVPGTGKTATVQEVVKTLQMAKESGELPEFKYIELNGMRLSNPERVYTELWSGITEGKERLAPANACEKLKTFITGDEVAAAKKRSRKKKRRLTIQRRKSAVERAGHGISYLVLVDELDLLWTRKQKVLYNLFDWPNHPGSTLVVLAIANTMDLPERILMNRVKSRLGMTRLVFHAYEFPQLQTIIQSRLEDLDCFDPDAIQMVARKVASVSGDARRALNICQKAAETAERELRERVREEEKSETSVAGTPRRGRKEAKSSVAQVSGQVTMAIVNQVIHETFSEPAVLAVKACSSAEKNFLRALISEFERNGTQEAKFIDVYLSFKALCVLDDFRCAGPREVLRLCENLAASGIVINEGAGSMGIHQRVMLNVSQDSIHFALNEFRDDDF